MQEHFAQEYGKRTQYFVYNSKQLSKIDAFASDAGMHVMIINTQAFNASMDEEKSTDKMEKGKLKKADKAARIISNDVMSSVPAVLSTCWHRPILS